MKGQDLQKTKNIVAQKANLKLYNFAESKN